MSTHHDVKKYAPPRMYYAVRSCNLLHAPAIFLDWIDVKSYIENDLKRSMEYKACESMVEAFEYIYRDTVSSTKISAHREATAIHRHDAPKSLVHAPMKPAFTSSSSFMHCPHPPRTVYMSEPPKNHNPIMMVSPLKSITPLVMDEDVLQPVVSREESTTENIHGIGLTSVPIRWPKDQPLEPRPLTIGKYYKHPVDERNPDHDGRERFEQLIKASQYESLSRVRERAKAVQFPIKLYEMLDRAEVEGFDDVIRWESNGRGFTIKDPTALENDVLPRFFRLTKYRSFLRQLQLYGFFRTISGPRQGLCYHELFRRGETDRLLEIQRSKRELS